MFMYICRDRKRGEGKKQILAAQEEILSEIHVMFEMFASYTP